MGRPSNEWRVLESCEVGRQQGQIKVGVSRRGTTYQQGLYVIHTLITISYARVKARLSSESYSTQGRCSEIRKENWLELCTFQNRVYNVSSNRICFDNYKQMEPQYSQKILIKNLEYIKKIRFAQRFVSIFVTSSCKNLNYTSLIIKKFKQNNFYKSDLMRQSC